MDTTTGAMMILGFCGVVLGIIFLRQRVEILLNFLVRSILGVMGIYFINILLEQAGISVGVGINPISILTVGSLGTGGIGLLYGILFYNIL